MTQFSRAEEEKEDASASSGKDFLEMCREHLEEVVADCVASYDGESVEDFGNDIIDSVWKVAEADLKRSFKNGRDYRRPGRPSRRSR